ncbi:MAG: hypothetical protein FWF84_05795 [Kiritimatiellaeota bacterium]|nr:hypothetical protein [Kiritimatiellota bacterium]
MKRMMMATVVAVACAWQVSGQGYYWVGGDGEWDTVTANWVDGDGIPVTWVENGNAFFTNAVPIVVTIQDEGIRAYQVNCSGATAGLTLRGGPIRGAGGTHLYFNTYSHALNIPLRIESEITDVSSQLGFTGSGMVTLCASITWKKLPCVLGVSRLISSHNTKWANIGPRLNIISAEFPIKRLYPRMSCGRRSTVH